MPPGHWRTSRKFVHMVGLNQPPGYSAPARRGNSGVREVQQGSDPATAGAANEPVPRRFSANAAGSHGGGEEGPVEVRGTQRRRQALPRRRGAARSSGSGEGR